MTVPLIVLATLGSALYKIPKQIEKFDAERIKGFLSKRPDEAAVRALAGDAVHMALVPAEEGAGDAPTQSTQELSPGRPGRVCRGRSGSRARHRSRSPGSRWFVG